MRSPAVVLLAFVLALVVAVSALPAANPPTAEAELIAPITDGSGKVEPQRCRTFCRWYFGEYICSNPCW